MVNPIFSFSKRDQYFIYNQDIKNSISETKADLTQKNEENFLLDESMTKLEEVLNSCRQTVLRNRNDNFVGAVGDDLNTEPGLDLYDSIISELSHSMEELVESSEIRNKFEIIREIMDKRKKRLADLEDALKGSIKLSLEREMVLQKEEERSKKILEKVRDGKGYLRNVSELEFFKVFKLEQRLASLQAAQAMRCHNCKPYVKKMISIETQLSKLVKEKKKNLKELFHMK